MTAEDILNKREQLSAYLTKEPEWWKEDIIMAMEEYAQLKLSEHSTKEPVAWLCERGLHKIVTIEQNEVDWCKENGYTVTELVKK